MGTKEIMASAPVAAYLYDAIFVAGGWRAAWKARGKVYAALAVTWIFLATLVYITVRLRVAIESASTVSPIDNIKTQCWAVLHYLRLVAWPSPLIFDYGMVGDGVPLLLDPARYLPYAVPIAFLLAMIAFGVWKRATWAFPATMFFMVLAPSSSFVPFKLDIVAEHRMYLPLAPLLTLVVIGVAWSLRRISMRDPILALSALFLAVPLAWCTHMRNRDFASDLTIWTDTAEKLPNSARAQTNLGIALADRGEYDAAIERHKESIRLRPDYSEAYHNLASVLMYAERFSEAEVEYRKALALEPNAWPSHLGLAEALLAQDKHDAAGESFAAALGRNSDIQSAYLRLGMIRQMQNRADEAVRLYEESIRRVPNDVTVLNQLGLAYAQLGRFDFAADRFTRALRIDPKFEPARQNLERVRAAARGQ
jgi:tetratricopeptide (TPR) repeat protein